MKKSLDILTIGDLCADLVLSGRDVEPEFGQKEKLVENYILEMGGSGSIFICQAARLGLRSAIIGRVGNDPFGDMILKALKSAGASAKFVKIDTQEKTGVTFMLNKGHDRAMMTYSGTIDAVRRSDVTEQILASTRHFHIASFFLIKRMQPYYKAIVKKAKAAGATISMDTNWDPEEKWDGGIREILPMVNVFLPNANELLAISGEKSLTAAVDKLSRMIPVVVLKEGEKGARAFSNGKSYQAKALKINVKDTVGSGDNFDAGFLYGFLNKKSIGECLKIGCICGGLSARYSGGTRGQPDLKLLKKYL